MAELAQAQLEGWVRNERQENPATRLAYGGVTIGKTVYLKTTEGKIITY